jgi:uncharacterized Zn finger protein (UPF0148 family)
VAPTRTDCPECGAGIKLPAGFTPGRTVRCPKCETRFVVEADDEDDAPAKPAGGRKPVRAAADDEDDAPKKPRKKKKKAAADDDGGWSYRSSWIRFAVLAVLLVVLGVLGYMLYQKQQREKEADRKPPEDPDATAKAPADPAGDGKKAGRPVFGPIGPIGDLAPLDPPGKAAPKADPAAVEEARKALVGEWEYRAGGEAYTVRYEDGGLFRYEAVRPGDPPATVTGRWAVSNPRRLPDPKGAAAARPAVQVTAEWGVVSKPGLKGDLVLFGDGTLAHPLLDRFEPGAGKPPVFRKK